MPLPSTGIILQNPAASPIPTAVAWSLVNQGLSSFAGTDPFYPGPPYGTATDVADCYFDIPNVQTLATAAYVFPPGMGYYAVSAVSGTASLQLQVGTVNTWVSVVATLVAGVGGFFVSDGTNVRINSGTSITFTLYPIRA